MKQLRSSSFVFSIILTAVVAALLPASSATARQRSARQSQEIVGIVTHLTANSLTIRTSLDDRDVTVTSATVVRVDDQPASLSVIAVGDKVEAHIQVQTDGSTLALFIDVESHSSTELEGTIRSVTATALTITTSTGDVTVTLTPDTHFFIAGRTAASSDLHVGDPVEVEARQQTDQTFTALVVKVQNNTIDLRGVISAASASSITVRSTTGDVVVAFNSSTLIRMEGKVANAGALMVGSRVEVEAVRNADQTLTAVSITVERSDALAEVEGSVTEVGTDHLGVRTKSGDEITISVDLDTIIRIDDRSAGLADIKVGDRVSVDARVSSTNTFTALRIEVESESGPGNGNPAPSVELNGVIASISSASISITGMNGMMIQVQINSQTVIRNGSMTLSLSDLHAGEVVEVKGQRNADGSIAATLIQVENAGQGGHPEMVEVSGTVTAASATSLTIQTGRSSVMVGLTSSTVVKKGDHAGSPSDLKVGQRVEALAIRNADGSMVATQVKIEDH